MTDSAAPVCPFCGAAPPLIAVAEERGEASPSVAITAGLALVAAGAVAAAALLVAGWIAWLLAALALVGLWQRGRAHQETAAEPAVPARWYCPECERTFTL